MRDVQTPAARATDPITSHLAASEITRNRSRTKQCAMVIAAVAAHPGMTSRELAQKCGLDRYLVARRLPECETGGAVTRGDARHCVIGGRRALTWWPL